MTSTKLSSRQRGEQRVNILRFVKQCLACYEAMRFFSHFSVCYWLVFDLQERTFLRRLCRKERARSSLLSSGLAELKRSHQDLTSRYDTLKWQRDGLNEISSTLEGMVSDMIQEIEKDLQPPVSPALPQASSFSVFARAPGAESPVAVPPTGGRVSREEVEEAKESPLQGEEGHEGGAEEAKARCTEDPDEHVGWVTPFLEPSASLGCFLQKLQTRFQRGGTSRQAYPLTSSKSAHGAFPAVAPVSSFSSSTELFAREKTMEKGRKVPPAPTLSQRGLHQSQNVRDQDMLRWARSESF